MYPLFVQAACIPDFKADVATLASGADGDQLFASIDVVTFRNITHFLIDFVRRFQPGLTWASLRLLRLRAWQLESQPGRILW